MMIGPLFHKEISSCGSKKDFVVSKISHNLYEAKAASHVALLWKEGEQWKSSSNFICEEMAAIIGNEIEAFLKKRSEASIETGN
jgi:hypothetical protein